jgi:hypothetical protein
MPYDVPTLDQFTTRFPVFENRDEDQIQQCIDEASRSVDDSWVEGDYQPAIMYLAAHLLMTDESQVGDNPVIGPTQGGVSAEHFGPMSITYKDFPEGSLSSSETFGTTSFGRKYLSLLHANKPPIVVV